MSLQAEQKVAGNEAGDDFTSEKKDNLEKSGSISKVESLGVGLVAADDPFQPLSGVEAYDGRRILTVRAVVTGLVLGSVILCANLYLGMSLATAQQDPDLVELTL